MEFKFISRYKNYYYVTKDGRVFSTDRKVRCHKDSSRIIPGKQLKGTRDKDGYLYVNLRFEGVSRNERIHRLVLEHFVGISDLVVDHLNGNKEDNRLQNLEYVTSQENTRRYHIFKKGSKDLVGVNFNKSQSTYKVTRWIDGKLKHFGTFKNIQDAVEFNKSLNI